MIAHYVLQPELHHGMDYLAEVYLKYETIKIEELIGPKGKNQKNMRDLSPTSVYKYACEDADVTLKLKKVLEKELIENNVNELFQTIEMPLVPVLAYMERNGVRIDTEALKETSQHFTARMKQLEEEVHQLAGMEFNIASPKQVGEVLFDRLKITDKAKKTKTGQYVTSEEVLESLRGKHEIVGKILEHRGLKKLLGTYIDALPLLINPRRDIYILHSIRLLRLQADLVRATLTCKIFLSVMRMEKRFDAPLFLTKAVNSFLPTTHKSSCVSWLI